jgi:preprotein translocase subunit SecF
MTQQEKVINFMGVRHYTSFFSMALLLVAIVSIAMNGLKFGLDFTGGTQLEVSLDRPADLPAIRQLLSDEGLHNPAALLFGSERDVLIRTQGSMETAGLDLLRKRFGELNLEGELVGVVPAPREQETYSQLVKLSGVSREQLQQSHMFAANMFGAVDYVQRGNELEVLIERSLDNVYTAQLLDKISRVTGASAELRRSEFVGPQVGEELRDQGGLGVLLALIIVMIYVAMRFQFKFSVGAVSALIYNVIIVLGFFSITQRDFDLTVLAAVLAVIGYSINDTIVVFDRIRDNFRILRMTEPAQVINISLTQVLERTLITSLTTMLTLVVLYFVGGEMINGFAIALIVGIGVGTYSSIYIASNILLAMKVTKEDLLPSVRQASEIDELP